MSDLLFFNGGRLITTDEEERKREIIRLKRKYHDTLVEYAKFQAEYPYTVKRAAKILARRNRLRRSKLRGVKSNDPHDDLIYPLVLENLQKAKKKMPKMRDTRTQKEVLESYSKQMEESPGDFAVNFDESKRNITNAKPVALFEINLKNLPDVEGVRSEEYYKLPHLRKWLSKEFGRSAKVYDSSQTKFIVKPVELDRDFKNVEKVLPERFYTWFSSAKGGLTAVVGIDIANTDGLRKIVDLCDEIHLGKPMQIGSRYGTAIVGSEKYPQRYYDHKTLKASGIFL